MKHSKAVYVTLKDIRGKRGYVYENSTYYNERDYLARYVMYRDFSCQFDSNRDVYLCTCKKAYRNPPGYYNTSREVYRYTNTEGFTDVGIGRIQSVPRKRVRRIYLPDIEDRGVGSADLSLFKPRTWNKVSYYEQRKTSSKCVGGIMEFNEVSMLSEKLSPISQTMSQSSSLKKQSKATFIESKISLPHNKHMEKSNKIISPIQTNIKPPCKVEVADTKTFSSDSFVQHVHNLENPSISKPSIEIKPVYDCKSSSMRKKFESLKRSFIKKVSKEHCNVTNSSSHDNAPIKKDVSIASDPPSLEARSFTDMKKHSPIPTRLFKGGSPISNRKPVNDLKESSQWSTHVMDGECRNVKDMFKLWGEKFKLDEDYPNKKSSVTTVDTTKKQKKKAEVMLPTEVNMENEKKERKRFSFFKRKNKDKSKQTYKHTKKGVTAGRCEVGDGLIIKVGAFNEYSPNKKIERISEEYDDLFRNNWLKRCLDKRSDSRKSVNIRWNNDMYTTSSSTVFELMECIYKNTGIIFRSKSELTSSTVPSTSTGDYGVYHHYYKRPQVNFMQQTVQAWMIPKIITENDVGKCIERRNPKYKRKKSIEVTYSNQKWFIDKSKAFSQKIKLVLNAKNFVEDDRAERSKYIVIDIPKGYFSGTSSEVEEPSQISNEQVYNIVEYDNVKSCSFVKIKSNDSRMNIGYHKYSDDRVTVNVKDVKDVKPRVIETVQNTSPHRDVVVQGSNVYVPRHCDVISVGVITQLPHNRDLRDIRNTMLKMEEDINVNKTSHARAPQKRCDLAESYLQDCYRRWIPLDVDLYSWCISDPNLGASSDNNSQNSHQDFGSKSCPNICDEYQTSAIISSYDSSSSSHYKVFRDTKKSDDPTTTYFNKYKKHSDDLQLPAEGIRVMPKDSVEVFKRRKIYAASKNANRSLSVKGSNYSVSSIEGKCKKLKESDSKQVKKHVSVKNLDESRSTGDGILSFKGSFGQRNKERCRVNPIPVNIPEPPCLDDSTEETNMNPPCEGRDMKIESPRMSRISLRLPVPPSPQPSICQPQKVRSNKVSPVQSKQKRSISDIKLKDILPCPKLCTSSKIQGNPSSRAPDSKRSILSSPPSDSHCPRLTRSSSAHGQRKLTPPRKLSPTPSTLPCNCKKQMSCGSSKCLSSKIWPNSSKKSLKHETSPKCSNKSLERSVSNIKNNKLSTAFQRFTKKCKSCVIKKESVVAEKKSGSLDDFMKKTIGKIKAFSQPCVTESSSKKTGIHLSKKPMPQISLLNEPKCNVISLNSKDNAFIKNISVSLSSIETTDARNIKVQDEDGNTLYERHEYRANDPESKDHLVTDLYRDSQVHRISTSKTDTVLKDENLETCESNFNLTNVVELNFNLKFKQADKNAEINVTQNITKDIPNENISSQEHLKDVYIYEDKNNNINDRIVDLEKRDVNIKIIINSYQQRPGDSNHNIKYMYNVSTADEFTRKISDKFHTVSTGYSDVLDLQTYSIHRTTLNYSDSTETSNNLIEPCEELVNESLPEKSPRNSTDTDSIVRHTFDQSASENNSEILHSTVLLSDGTTNSCTSATDKEDVQSLSDVQHSDIEMSKIRDKEEKKQILKEIFESSDVAKAPAKKLRGIRKLLRYVLSSDSSGSGDVVKKSTEQSLKPKIVKESESMTNYYQYGSSMSDNKTSKNKIILPTVTYNSTDTTGLKDDENLQCRCHLDTLNVQEHDCKTCCCGSIDTKDQEVYCNLIHDISLNKPNCVNVETQDSKKDDQKKSAETITSYIEVLKPKVKNKKRGSIFDKLPKNIFSSPGKIYAKKRKRQPVLGLSNDSKIMVLNSEPKALQDEIMENSLKPIDILQLHETKKAVLEIYTERSHYNKGHFVAKLPKFVYNKESQICNCYQELVRDLIQANHSVTVL